jgi:hypothetical protein
MGERSSVLAGESIMKKKMSILVVAVLLEEGAADATFRLGMVAE